MKRVWARLKAHWVRHLLAAVQVAIGVAVVSAVFLDVVPALRSAGGEQESGEIFMAMYGYSTPTLTSFSTIFTADDVEYLVREA